jgi:hypothetical protein
VVAVKNVEKVAVVATEVAHTIAGEPLVGEWARVTMTVED